MSSRYSVIHKMFPHVYKLRDNYHGHYVISKNYGDKNLIKHELNNLQTVDALKNKKTNIHFQKPYLEPISKDLYSIQTYYVPGNDLLLYYHLKKYLREDTLKYLIDNIYCGIKILQKNNLVHCDIKPENIVFEEKTKKITIIDFYSLKYVEKYRNCDRIQGTRRYMSPELKYKNQIHINSDLWSLGITAAVLSIGFNPFQRHGVNYSNVQHYTRQLLEQDYSKDYINTICNLLHTNPEDRKFIHFK